MFTQCYCSLANPGTAGAPVHFFIEDGEPGRDAKIAEFIRREDRPGRGVYYCIGLLSRGARQRNAESVAALASIVVDLDLKKIVEARDEVSGRLRDLLLPPSEIRNSGNGIHAIWRLKEPLVDEAGLTQAEKTMKRLVALLAGDPLPTHRAALLRVPGSHNSKDGNWSECRVLEDSGKDYDISEFEDMFDLYGDRPLLTCKSKEVNSVPSSNGSNGPVDVGARLAAMRWQGAGDSSIHLTQLHVTASLTRDSHPVEQTVERVLAATREAAKGDPNHSKWDWEAERFAIERMCYDLINKAEKRGDSDLSCCLPDAFYDKWQEIKRSGGQPSISYNRHGAYVRGEVTAKENGSQAATATPNENTDPEVRTNGNVLRLVSSQEEKPRAALSIEEWLSRSLPEPVFCLGSWLTTTSRALLYAPTGIGKSMLALAIAFAMSGGNSLLHWPGRKPMRVLYIDGEMAQRLLKRRIAEEAARSDSKPQSLFVLNTGDIEDFRPLDDPRGRLAIDDEISRIDGVDFLILDNVMALLGGDMRDEESWRKTVEWQKSLTRRHVGQLWIHHTGHDETRGYGTKTREWQMDTVIALESVERPESDVSFQLTFKKARERTPETRIDFVDVRIALINNRWTYETVTDASSRRPSPLGNQFLKALTNVIASDDAVIYRGERAARLDAWRRECVTLGILDPGTRPDSARSLLSKHRRELIQCNLIACHDDLTWLLHRVR